MADSTEYTRDESARKSRYDDPLAQAIYEGRAKTAGPYAMSQLVPWPRDRKECTKLEHEGGNAAMDLAIGSANEARKRGLA